MVWESKQRNKNTARHKEPQPRQQETTGKKKKRLGKKTKPVGDCKICTEGRPSQGKLWGKELEEEVGRNTREGCETGRAAGKRS